MKTKISLPAYLYILFLLCISCGAGGGSGGEPGQSNEKYSIGGVVSGLSGVVALTLGEGEQLLVNGDGSFQFTGALSNGDAYIVAVEQQPEGQYCYVNNRSGTVAGAPVLNISVNCQTIPFSLSGEVVGLTGALTLNNSNGDTLVLASNGPFTFSGTMIHGSNYEISVAHHPDEQICTVNNGIGSVQGENVTNVSVTCSTITYSVGGNATGLSGTLILRNNGVDDLELSSDGPFSFGTTLAQGAAYSVAIVSQPAGQICGIVNAAGAVSESDIQTIVVDCLTPDRTARVSVASDGTQANGPSYESRISVDGRYVAFTSEASNLVSGDTNQSADIFVHDVLTGITSRVSLSNGGAQANDDSYEPSISGNGRRVAFYSFATNLVTGDTNQYPDIFVRDLDTATTKRVSVSSSGAQSNCGASNPAMSADGRFVAFTSIGCNLVPGDTNYMPDIFVHDMTTGQTTRVSVAYDGSQITHASEFPAINADGRYVTFNTGGTVVPRDYYAFQDTFIRDRTTGLNEMVSVSSDGTMANGSSYFYGAASLSADGMNVAFYSEATNLVPTDNNNKGDVFLRRRGAGETLLVSAATGGLQANGVSYSPKCSADGRFVAFSSQATNLVAEDTNGTTDAFLFDSVERTTIRVSLTNEGLQASGGSGAGGVSRDGGFIVFGSGASNLVEGDTNGVSDIFVRRR